VAGWEYEHHQLTVEVVDKHNDDHHKYSLDLPGIYQTKNLLTVLEARINYKYRDGKQIRQHSKSIATCKTLTGLHGRWEVIHHDPVVYPRCGP
jgi:dihydrofolate synthase/folylpolyglutamate synthase